MADTIKTFRVELSAEGLAAFQKVFGAGARVVEDLGKQAKVTARELDALQDEALRMNDTWRMASSRAAGFADNMGKVSTTLARSADTIGLPAGPLRALDDVMDVTELGFSNMSKSAAGFNASSLGVAGAGLAIGVALGTMARQIPAVAEAADAAAKSIWSMFDPPPQFSEGQAEFTARMSKVNDQVLKAHAERLRAAGKTNREIAAILSGKEEVVPKVGNEGALARLGLDAKTLDAEDKAADEAKKKAEKILEDRKREAQKFQELKDQLSGKKAQLEVNELTKAFGELGVNGVADLEALRAKLVALEKQGAKIGDRGLLGVMKGGKVAIPELIDPNVDLGPLGEMPGELTASLKPAQAAFTDMASTMAQAGMSSKEISSALETAGANAGEVDVALSHIPVTLGSSFKGALANLPQTILGAIQGGGNVGQSIGASLGTDMAADLTKSLSTKLIGTLGKAIGSLIPGLGTLLGSGLGAAAGKLFGKLFSSEAKKVNDLRDAFLESQGGFVALQQKLVGLSNQDLVKKIFDAKTVDGFNAAVAETMGLLDTQAQAQQAVNDALQRYGIDAAEAGGQIAAAGLSDQAQQLFQDWTVLEAKQANMVAIGAKMAPNVSDFVAASKAAGQAIPEAMRPMLETMAKNGQLLDENGNAFESIEAAGLKFAKTQAEMWETLIEKLDRWTSALMGIPQELPAVRVPVTFETRGGHVTLPNVEDIPSFADGSDGFQNFGSGTLAMLHGLEAVVPKGSEAGLGGATVNVYANVNENPLQDADGRRMHREFTVKQIRRELTRSLPLAIAAGQA